MAFESASIKVLQYNKYSGIKARVVNSSKRESVDSGVPINACVAATSGMRWAAFGAQFSFMVIVLAT
jgi:hypothetical protein